VKRNSFFVQRSQAWLLALTCGACAAPTGDAETMGDESVDLGEATTTASTADGEIRPVAFYLSGFGLPQWDSVILRCHPYFSRSDKLFEADNAYSGIATFEVPVDTICSYSLASNPSQKQDICIPRGPSWIEVDKLPGSVSHLGKHLCNAPAKLAFSGSASAGWGRGLTSTSGGYVCDDTFRCARWSPSLGDFDYVVSPRSAYQAIGWTIGTPTSGWARGGDGGNYICSGTRCQRYRPEINRFDAEFDMTTVYASAGYRIGEPAFAFSDQVDNGNTICSKTECQQWQPSKGRFSDPKPLGSFDWYKDWSPPGMPLPAPDAAWNDGANRFWICGGKVCKLYDRGYGGYVKQIAG
jgi:hypothetical protein